MKLWLDIETRSSIPIKRGVAKYATEAEVIIVQWAEDDGPVQVTDLTASHHDSGLIAAAMAHDEIWAHGAEFEQTLVQCLPWWPQIRSTKWRCTMALARMHGLPGGLEKLSTLFKLGIDEAKDGRGKALIQLFCVPRPDGLYNDRATHPAEWAEFCEYGAQDVTAMRAVYRACPKWNATPRMWAAWHLDQKMNARGVAIDLKLAEGAVAATTRAKRRMAARTAEITEDEVQATTQRARLLAYMADHGVALPDLTADTVERRLNDDNLPEHIKELLRIRQQASKASTAKYQRGINQHVGGRLRNLLVFCGAARTGRWAGRTLQPQNLPRPKHGQDQIDAAVAFFRRDAIELYSDDVMGLASSSLRGLIVAAEGRKLCVADYANIEGRDMAWLAGEHWKIEAFRAFDAKTGPDLYKLAYARAFNIDPATIGDDDQRRQIGKVMELALQYYGGVGAFCAMAETYRLDLDAMAEAAWPVLPEIRRAEAQAAWLRAVKRRRTYELPERVWVVCQALVTMWRLAHPAIVGFWAALERAVDAALRTPNTPFRAGRVTIDRQGNWLRVRLPSGRYLSYPAPRIEEGNRSFLGVNPYSKQWERIKTYSGKLAENITQGVAADHMMDALLVADAAGYCPVLSVHDEALTEPPDEPQYNDKALSALIVRASPWAEGLPLAAKGFTAKRYRK